MVSNKRQSMLVSYHVILWIALGVSALATVATALGSFGTVEGLSSDMPVSQGADKEIAAPPLVRPKPASNSESGDQEVNRPRYVLILNSYRPDTRYTQLQIDAIRHGLSRFGPQRVNFYYEYLDVVNDNDERFFMSLSAWYHERYEHRNLDLVITTDSPALKFALIYGDAAFPGVPIVFSGGASKDVLKIVNNGRATGVVESVDVAGTIRLAMQLQPNLKHIILLTDRTKHSKNLESVAREEIKPFDGQLEFEWQFEGDSDDLERRVAKLGDDWAVLLLSNYYLGYYVTGSEQTQLRKFCRESPIPVYGLYDSYIEEGVLGGVVASGDSQGSAAAELAMKVLKGASVSSVPVLRKSPNVTAVNWPAMQRWRIPESRLPPGAAVRFREWTFFELYGTYILAGIACVVIEAAIIFSFLFNLIRRWRAERELRSQQSLLDEIIATVPHAVFWKDCNSVYQGCNPQYARDVGLSGPEEVVGKTDFDLHSDPELIDDYIASDRAVIESRRSILNSEEFQRLPNGDVTSLLVSKAPLFDESGEVRGVLGVYSDITRMKQERARLTLLSDIATNVTSTMPVEEIIRRTVGKIFEEFPGIRVSYSTVDSSGLLEVVVSHQPEGWASLMGVSADLSAAPRYLAALRSGQSVVLSDTELEPPDLDVRKAVDSSLTRAIMEVPVRNTQGLVGILAFCSPAPREWSEHELEALTGIASYLSIALQESAAREQAISALASLNESEAKFFTFLNKCPVVAFMKDEEGRMLFINEACAERFGIEQDAWNGKTDAELWPPATAKMLRDHDMQVLQSGVPIIVPEIIELEGEEQFWTSYKFPFRDAAGRLYLAGMAIETTHQRAVEQALKDANEQLELRVLERTSQLKESEERFQKLSDAAFEGIVIHENGRILAANRALASMFGYLPSELLGMTRRELVAPRALSQTRDELTDAIGAGGDEVRESIGLRSNGETFPIELRGKWVPYQGRLVRVTAIRDVSQHKRVQEEKLQHQAELAHVLRQVTLGELASGLAHELNQPLAAISNYTSAAMRRLRENSTSVPDALQAMGLVAEQGERAAQIIRRVRTFAKKGDANRSPCDINDIVLNAQRLVDRELVEAGVVCENCLTPGLPRVDVDAIQIEQVMINLIRNACDAMADVAWDLRRITVVTQMKDAMVNVIVKDNGPGMDSEASKRLFEAFSSTKPDGMGLGLSISRGIIEAHGGRIRHVPGTEGGTAFEFSLPVAE